MLLWAPEGTPSEYLNDFPHEVAVGFLPAHGALPADAARVEFLITPYFRATQSVHERLAELKSLKVVQTYSAGVEWIQPYIPDGVLLCNAKGVHDSAVAEWTLAAILWHYKKFGEHQELQRRNVWSPIKTEPIAGKNLTILGYGSIGAAVERRLAPCGVNFIRVARSARVTDDEDPVFALDDLPKLLPKTNILLILLPLTPETNHMVGSNMLSQLPDNAVVINAARGAILDADALLGELSNGRLHAILDVTDPEPLPDHSPLWTAPNLLLTQHTAGDTTDYLGKVYKFITLQVKRYVDGEPLLNVVKGSY